MSEEIQDAQMVPVEQTKALAKPVHRPILTPQAIKDETEQRKLLGQFISANMVEGIDGDYGVIPGTTKRTLLKPGAEKLVQLFYCSAKYVVTSKVENYDTGLFSYQFKCEILNGEGYTVAEGVGFCSTYESKYRWTSPQRKCPACGKDAIIKGKQQWGGGWVCWDKKGGCGEKFKDDDKDIVSQDIEQVQNPDIMDKVNSVLKIAKKRALVDAAISLARCSDMFTQDMEDAAPPAETPKTQKQELAQDVERGKSRAAAKKAETNAEAVTGGNEARRPAPDGDVANDNRRNLKCPNPECGKSTVGRSMYPPRNDPDGIKGWFCYGKSGGCNKAFPYDHPAFHDGEPEQDQTPKDKPKEEDNNEIMEGHKTSWKEWCNDHPGVEGFNKGYEASLEDLKKLSKDDRKIMWNFLLELAAKQKLVWDKDKAKWLAK